MYRTFSLRERSSNVLRRGVSVKETATETALAAEGAEQASAGHGGVREEQTADQKGGQGPQDRGASGVAGAVESVDDRESRRRADQIRQEEQVEYAVALDGDQEQRGRQDYRGEPRDL